MWNRTGKSCDVGRTRQLDGAKGEGCAHQRPARGGDDPCGDCSWRSTGKGGGESPPAPSRARGGSLHRTRSALVDWGDSRRVVGSTGPRELAGAILSRSRSVYVNIARALPPDEPLAGLMGRLLVLRADVLVETAGLTGDGGLEALDKFDEAYRRLYFVRSQSRTLYSGRILLHALGGNPLFKSLLEQAADRDRDNWYLNKKAVDRAGKTIEAVRNTIGAHAEQHVDEAVRRMHPDAHGWMETHSELGFRPRLAGDLVLATLLLGHPLDEARERFGQLVDNLHEALIAWMRATNIAVELYCRRYTALWPERR